MASSKKVLGWEVTFDFRYYFSEVWQENKGFDVVIGNPPYVQIQKFDNQTKEDWQKQNYTTFAKTGDIYCLFYEKGGQLLKRQGCLTFITSNKWMRAKYGQKLRRYFLDQVAVRQLIDFGDSPIFSEATTYTNILLFTREKGNRNDRPLAWDLTEAYRASQTLERMLADNEQGMPVFSPDSFIIIPEQLARIKQRLEQQGIPLKDWDVHINYGIKTGFNEAFIIDGRTREKLIARDPKNAEILKPILRGRDIKRYHADFADLWLVDTHNGFQNEPPVDISHYPAIKEHLEKVEQKRVSGALGAKAQKAKGLFKRDDQGLTPYNLRNCAYHQEFEKEKIVWPETSVDNQIFCDENNFFLDKTCFFMVPGNKYLLAVLNSTIVKFYLSLLVSKMRGGYFSMSKIYVEQVPVKQISSSRGIFFEILTDYVQLVKTVRQKLQAAYFEQLIDGLVYELYFPDELKKAGKELFPHLGTIKPLSPAMSPEEKLAIIQDEFDRLYDPEHPIRNTLETLDSVEEVRIIQQAVQR